MIGRPDDGAEDPLDRDFPLGDGTAETVAEVACPYCGAAVEVALDPGGGADQHYVEDCQVCCRPWAVSLRYGRDGRARLTLQPLDD